MKKIIIALVLLVSVSALYAESHHRFVKATAGETGKRVTRVPAAVLASLPGNFYV